MTETDNSEALCHKPTLREKAYRALGYRYHLGEDPEDAPDAGWMRTDIRFQFGWADRLRLILTGHLFVASVVHMDTPSPDKTKSRVDYRIFAPGERLI